MHSDNEEDETTTRAKELEFHVEDLEFCTTCMYKYISSLLLFFKLLLRET
jgi:hypothetical protein